MGPRATAQAQHQVERGLLLDVVVGERAAVLELLAGKDQALLVARDLHNLVRSESRGQLTRTEGTHAFWAPEMVRGEGEVTRFSGYTQDIWAVGVCAWIFAFSDIPFDDPGFDDDKIWDKIKNSDPVWPTTAFDAETLVDPELKELINKFLTKDPKQRISLPEAQEKKNCAWILKNLYEVVILRTCISCCADYQTP